MKKILRHLFLSNEKGGAGIAFIMIASAGIIAYIYSVNGFIGIFSKQKSKTQAIYSMQKLHKGILNYTVYAIKERWCMDSNWGRSDDCGATMKEVVMNPLNLERLLWSNTASDAIKDLYYTENGEHLTESPMLDNIKVDIPVASLSGLGISHPINLVFTQKLKNCFKSISIDISRDLSVNSIPDGDESLLNIKISGNRNSSTALSCKNIDSGRLDLDASVAFFPRTLHQYSVIKAGDFDLNNYKGNKSDVGINFRGPVYIDNEFKLNSSNFSPVAFFDLVRLGRGNLTVGNKNYSPEKFGHSTSRTTSDFKKFRGLRGGILQEAVPDEGLAKLFGLTYSYPPGVSIDTCIKRAELKDNPFITKDSRLFIKRESSSYILGLSKSNEFRTNKVFGIKDGYSITDKESTELWNASGSAKYLARAKDEFSSPVMKAVISKDGTTISEVALGRSTKVNVSPFLSENLNAFKDFLSQTRLNSYQYVGDGIIDSRYKKYIDQYFSSLSSKQSNLSSLCSQYISNGYNSFQCSKVFSQSQYDALSTDEKGRLIGTVNCSLKSDPADCTAMTNSLNLQFNEFIDEAQAIEMKVGDVISYGPALQLSTSDKLAGELKFDIKVVNTIANNQLMNELDRLMVKIIAFDFAMENVGDSEQGNRYLPEHLPGPNSTESSNSFFIQAEYDGGVLKEFDILVNKVGTSKVELNQKINDTSLPYGWTLLRAEKNGAGAEPPFEVVDGNKVDIYPEGSISTADAASFDELCSGNDSAATLEWDVSFTANTQFSWLINLTMPGVSVMNPSSVLPLDEYEFSEVTADDMNPYIYQGVPLRSIVTKCTVKPEIESIFGFYVCNEFIIEGRTKPLNIIGTLVVNNLNISDSAIKSGVNFYSMWSPRAIDILKQQKHLRRTSKPLGSDDCEFILPGWHPNLTDEDIADYNSCSPLKFIFNGANNFNWTTIDPEIGVTSTGAHTQTQSKIPNRYRRYTSKIQWTH